MTPRTLIPAVATLAVSALLLGTSAVAGNEHPPSAGLTVTMAQDGSTLVADVQPGSPSAWLYVDCPASGPGTSLLDGGTRHVTTVESGCDGYALTVDAAVETP